MATLKKSTGVRSSMAPNAGNILIIAALLIVAGVAALASWYSRLPVATGLTNDTINEPLVGAARAVVELDLGAGRLQLEAGTSDQMLSGRVQTLTGVETFERTARAQDGAMVYRLVSDAPRAVREPVRWPEWTLSVNPKVPTELIVRGGMGASNLDLSGLNLTNVVLEPETARYTVIFPNRGDVDATVEGGASQTTLVVPEGVALKAVVQVEGAGHIELAGRVYRSDATYTSPHYAAADNRLDLVVSSNLAHVVIEQHYR